ncbi:MAG TPA: hypothetical protein VLK65_17365 [Vicinamibacteria bacterium]|nr:hypothetical protein [Vicinamibacteria bacterium]
MSLLKQTGSILVLGLGLASCGDSGGSSSGSSGPSVTVSAPAIVEPIDGAQVTGQVTLTVANVSVTGGGTPTYTFQIAADSAFTDIVAQASDIPQDPSGRTSWTIGSELASGEFFWRARASVGGTMSTFSQVGRFVFQGGVETRGATDRVLLFDPLTNGTTLGDVGGGEFVSEGWMVVASSNFIVYDMETIETGFLEFDIKGLDIRNPTRDARQLFFMWDPSIGSDMTSNRFRVSLQKLDGRSSINDFWLRLRFISQGRQTDVGSTFRGWVPERTYRIRLEWGREGEVNVCRLFINDMQIFFFHYPRPYIPQIHRIELGAAGRAETPEGAIYSNVVIGTR